MISGHTDLAGLRFMIVEGELQVFDLLNPDERWTQEITDDVVSHFRFLAMLAEIALSNDVRSAGELAKAWARSPGAELEATFGEDPPETGEPQGHRLYSVDDV